MIYVKKNFCFDKGKVCFLKIKNRDLVNLLICNSLYLQGYWSYDKNSFRIRLRIEWQWFAQKKFFDWINLNFFQNCLPNSSDLQQIWSWDILKILSRLEREFNSSDLRTKIFLFWKRESVFLKIKIVNLVKFSKICYFFHLHFPIWNFWDFSKKFILK